MIRFASIHMLNLVSITLCFTIYCFCNISANVITQNHVNNAEVTQIRIPLTRHKSTFHRLLEMGIKPDLMEQMSKKKHNPNSDRENDTIPLFKYKNSEFFGEVLLGHPGQTFKVIFDTAWGDSFVPSKSCSFYSLACHNHALYDHTRSSEYKPNGTKFEVKLDVGVIKGYLSEDLLHIGHINITNQTFAEITQLPFSFYSMKSDGVFGMAFKKLSKYNANPFFYNLKKQYPNIPNLFSFYLNKDVSSKKGGSLILGAVDKDHLGGNITQLDVIDDEYWTVAMDSVFFKNPMETLCSGGCTATIDTGSSLIGIPEDDLERLYRRLGAFKVPFSAKYQVNCEDILKLPKMNFVLKNVEFQIKAKDYVQKINYGPLSYCMLAFENSKSKGWFLGGVFLYQFYTVFDIDKKQVGIAKTQQ